MKSIEYPKCADLSSWNHVQALIIVFLLASLSTPASASEPIKVFILAGQSNMQGQGLVEAKDSAGNEKPGTLTAMLANPVKGRLLKGLRTPDGKWVERDDIWVYDINESGIVKGPLGFGYGWDLGNKKWFGPELQFGHVIKSRVKEQALIIKTAWGGKSLYKDFRPPSSGGEVGPFYAQMLATVKHVLGNLKQEFPTYEGQGYVLAGFVWWHGWNDFCDPQHAVPEYERNLANLIRDLRHDLQTPGLPVVIGEFTGPWGADCKEPAALAIRHAQEAVAAMPEFRKNVRFVLTHDYVRSEQESPTGEGYHEFKNGETYFLIGDALGKGMLPFIGKSETPRYVMRRIEGWTVHIHPALLENDRVATEAALALLRKQLAEIKRVVPAPALAKIHRVPLWFSPEYPGIAPRAEYHPGGDWLRENGRNPDMAKCVEFTDVLNFEKETKRMPCFVLHELAHAYHDQTLGFDNLEIQAAYKQAKAGKSYDLVERWFGNGQPNTFERAYAMTSPQEYFAESSEAYFGRNDFFPFTRKELEKHDPQMFALLQRFWNRPLTD